MAYDITVIRNREELGAILPAWEKFLATSVSGSNLWNDPAHIDLLLAAEPDHSLHLVVVRSQNRIHCIAPFLLRHTRFRLQFSLWTLASLPVRMLKLMGDQFVHSSDADREACFNAVFTLLQRERQSFDLIFIHTMDCSGALWEYCSGPLAAQIPYRLIMASPRVEQVHQIKLPETHEVYLASLNPKTRQNLRRTTRKLFADGKARMVRVTAPEQVQGLLEGLDSIMANTWQAKTFGYRNQKAAAGRRYLEQLAARGWLRSYLLMRDGHPIAYELGFQYRGTYYGEDCGYDLRWKDWGPGSILMHLVIEDLFRDRPPHLLDFGLGDAPYKRSFGNQAYPAAPFYLTVPGRWRALTMLQRAINGAFLAGRTALVKSGLDTLVRRILKHKA